MALSYRRLRSTLNSLPRIFPGYHYRQYRRVISSLDSFFIPLPRKLERVSKRVVEGGWYAQRFSTVTEVSTRSPPNVDLLSFIHSTFDELEGPYHCWVNKVEGDLSSSERDGIFLILTGQFLGNPSKSNSDIVNMLEKVKSIQHRFPHINVFGFQSGCSISSADYTHLVKLIMKEYITFPILLSKNNFSEIENDGGYYILFKDFGNPVLYHQKDLDIVILNKAIEELSLQHDENPGLLKDHLFSNSWNQSNVIKEPNYCSYLQKLLFYFPGCISADESGSRLFVSDSNHHRVIIFDGDGKIVDCIGSSPGFEDGEFENAKLIRPAASFYHDEEDCLYIVDSENHAIRRADMETRVLETIYPVSLTNKKNSAWTWIKDKLGMGSDDSVKSEEFDSRSMRFPWHLMKSEDNCFLVIDRSFETLWVIDSASGEITEVIEGFQKIFETIGPLIMEKISPLKQMPCDWLQQQVDSNFSLEGFEYASLMSSMATYQNHLIICDTVGQRVLKFDKESGVFSNLGLSNFSVLGLPYWLSLPLERAYLVGGLQASSTDHVQDFELLPGRVSIRVNINIPQHFELAEPLQEDCVLCHARGAAVVISDFEDILGSSEKVTVAQQWYDELDGLASSVVEPEEEPSEEKDISTFDLNTQDEGVHLDCVINTSPGASEVIIYSALYLKPERNTDSENNQEQYAARIADILCPESSGRSERDSCVRFLLKSNRDLQDLVFVKPLHVRLNFDCELHPKARNSKDVTVTNSSVQVNVSL